MEAWNNTTDGILINLLAAMTSIPLVTIGAAMQVTKRRAKRCRRETPVVRTWASYKSSLGKQHCYGYHIYSLALLWLVCGLLHEPWAMLKMRDFPQYYVDLGL